MTIYRVRNWLEFLRLAQAKHINKAVVSSEPDHTLTVRVEE